MSNAEPMVITMNLDSRLAWNYLLQKGFYLNGQSGLTVRQFLMDALGYDDSFIDETVRTIFLNNSPVDDIDNVHVQDGDRMALGSAMPGLVGIVMGRDNPYKSFRSGIACEGDDGDSVRGEPIRVFMKIFSVLAVKTGTDILKRGIEIDVESLCPFLGEHAENILEGGAELPSEGNAFISVTFA